MATQVSSSLDVIPLGAPGPLGVEGVGHGGSQKETSRHRGNVRRFFLLEVLSHLFNLQLTSKFCPNILFI